MDRLGPFERCPALAVAVSGGADSMALAMLGAMIGCGSAADQSRALVVDHGLRAGSADEARITDRTSGASRHQLARIVRSQT